MDRSASLSVEPVDICAGHFAWLAEMVETS
jgi:hypothetical protein